MTFAMTFIGMMIIAATSLSTNAIAQEKAATTAPVQGNKMAPKSVAADSTKQVAANSEAVVDDPMAGLDDDSVAAEALTEVADTAQLLVAPMENEGFHQSLKRKFIEGNAGFMSLVALALILGLAFCIERIIYLTLSEIDAKRLLADVSDRMAVGDIDGAKALCTQTRGPVAAICYQGLDRLNESVDDIERSVASYGAVQAANLEKGCSWIKLFIVMAPSLGFLGTVIGMVMAFDQIQQAGDISPTIVAAGMKVALITTIFGIIVALILQLFYNYILSKIEHLTAQMEESAITLMDAVTKYKQQ